MKNTPGHPDQESPRASSESLLLRCVICHTSLKDPEMTACGIGHICYDCWDDLPEGRVMG